MPTSTHPVRLPPTPVHAYTPECLHFPPTQLSTLNVQSLLAAVHSHLLTLCFTVRHQKSNSNSYVYTSLSNTHLYLYRFTFALCELPLRSTQGSSQDEFSVSVHCYHYYYLYPVTILTLAHKVIMQRNNAFQNTGKNTCPATSLHFVQINTHAKLLLHVYQHSANEVHQKQYSHFKITTSFSF